MKNKLLFIALVLLALVQGMNSQTVQNPVSGTKDYAITGGTGTYANPGYLRVYGVNSSGVGGNVLIRAGVGMGTQGSINLELQTGGTTHAGSINLNANSGKINLIGNTYVPKIYDYNNNSYYLDPSSTGTSIKVAGKIESKEIEVVDLDTKSIQSDEIKTIKLNVQVENVADYVFKKDYNLRTLAEVEQYINENSHLPDVPAGKELEENGMNVAEMNNLLLQKIEELTLYIIQQDKKITELELLIK